MRFNGWKRLLIVLSVGWAIIVGVRAYAEYPNRDEFGGIPVGPFTFWSVVTETSAGGHLSYYAVVPRTGGFIAYGLLPIVVLWVSFVAVGWVRRGFIGNEAQPDQMANEVPAGALSHPDAPERNFTTEAIIPSQQLPSGEAPAYLFPLRILRGFFGFVGAWQILGLLPALTLMGNFDALVQADLGKLAALTLVKVLVASICFAVFFGLRSAINKAHCKHCGIPHPSLNRTWSL